MKYTKGAKVKIKSKERLLKDIEHEYFFNMNFKNQSYIDKLFSEYAGKFVTISYIDKAEFSTNIPEHYHAQESGDFRFTDDYIETNQTMRELLE